MNCDWARAIASPSAWASFRLALLLQVDLVDFRFHAIGEITERAAILSRQHSRLVIDDAQGADAIPSAVASGAPA